MRRALENTFEGYDIYHARRAEFDTGQRIPFRVSPTPFMLKNSEVDDLRQLGPEITQYMEGVRELYVTNQQVTALLNRNKPDIFTKQSTPDYLFLRPDLVLTSSGFSICEIETSPFGLGLADGLNTTYANYPFDLLVEPDSLTKYISQVTPRRGEIVYTQKTSSYEGQLHFMADKIFSGVKRHWSARRIDEPESGDHIYRAFYLIEALTNPLVQEIIASSPSLTPSLTPWYEEKAVMAFLWDIRYEKFFKDQLGKTQFDHLRRLMPETWILGQERYFSPGLPEGITSSLELASLAKSRREYVLKVSGFSLNGSWSEGVVFLHESAQTKAKNLLQKATEDESSLYILQRFHKGVKMPVAYETPDGIQTMVGKARITPYFATRMGGKLIAIKATICENTDLIHGSSTSVNTAVGVSNDS